MKKLAKLICVLLSISVLSFALCACTADEAEETETQSVSEVSSISSAEGESTTADETQLTAVETSIGELYYPSEYSDYLSVEEGDDSVEFTAELNGETYTLFTLSFGEGEGASVGTVVDGDGNEQDVFVELASFDGYDLSETDLDLLYAMQEGVNTIIENLD